MAADPSKHQACRKYLLSLMDRADIIGLQEVHGTAAIMHEYFKGFPGWVQFVSPSISPAAGGVAILVNKGILNSVCTVIPQVLLPGRGLRVLLQMSTYCLNVLCLHVEPAATRPQQHLFLSNALSTADAHHHATFVLADLNTCLPGDHRVRLHGPQEAASDDGLGSWISQQFPRFTVAEHDGFTRLGLREGLPHVLSRIDYILTDTAKPTLLDGRFSGFTHGNLFKHTASDHIAVLAALHPPRAAPTDRQMIPSWISSSSRFKDSVTTLIKQHLQITANPLTKDDLLEIFRVAAQRYRDRPSVDPPSASAKLHWSLIAFRSIRAGSDPGLRRALRAVPSINPDTLEQDIGTLTVEVAEQQLQGRTGHSTAEHRKGESAGAAFMAKIALWRRHTSRSKFFHIKDKHDIHHTTDHDMARLIRSHWQTVFQSTNEGHLHDIDMSTLISYVPEASGICNDPFDEDDIAHGLRRSDTAPGPDGVCYSAWKAAGPDGIKVLLNLALDMWNGGDAPPSFRRSLMVFLPKSEAVALAPEELRPLSLCDVDYKIVMSCINHRLAQLLPDFVDDRQRGFMKQRLGLDNVLLLEATSMIAARSGTVSPALCFLDIAAAFPSILHDYMLQVVSRFLGPHPLAHMIGSMYHNNECDMIIRGNTYPGFRIYCGVRQGCPLSGSLFALCFHPVILHLSNMMYRHSMHIAFHIYAYADDLACIMFEFWKQLETFAACLSVIASAAGLHINWRKVQIIPLHRHPNIDLFRRRLSATRPAWAAAKIALQAKYLGFIVGPEVTDKVSFAGPLLKYIERCRFISRLGLGWAKAAEMHNIFALPVLSYIAQLQSDRGIEDKDLDRSAAILFKCPMYRPPYNFFANIGQLGVNLGLKDIRLECKAAAARAAMTLSCLALARRTMAQGSDDDHLLLHPLRPWQSRSATTVLGSIHDTLRRSFPDGIHPPHVQRQCRLHLQGLALPFAYLPLVRARLTTVLRRIHIEDPSIIDTTAMDVLKVISLVNDTLHCTALTAFLRLSQNAFSIGIHGDASQPCPLCGAPAAARLSHVCTCGALWVFLAEECPGLGWDYSSPHRWRFLFGSLATDAHSAALLCLAWDCIQAGLNAGRFGQHGNEGCLSRLVALANRPGVTGRLARALSQPPVLVVQ
jgi:hypothetical protein